jgi:hypothetical protein
MNRALRLAWIIVVLAGAAGAAMFVAQGGFGGGHGKFDLPLIVVALPWSILPWPELIEHDVLWLVAFPFILNVTLLGILTAVLRKRTTAG